MGRRVQETGPAPAERARARCARGIVFACKCNVARLTCNRHVVTNCCKRSLCEVAVLLDLLAMWLGTGLFTLQLKEGVRQADPFLPLGVMCRHKVFCCCRLGSLLAASPKLYP